MRHAILIATAGLSIWGGGIAAAEESLSVTIHSNPYQIIDTEDGQRIELDSFGYLTESGRPLLPEQDVLVLLPPGARAQSIEIEEIESRPLAGSYRISPAFPLLPLSDAYGTNEELRVTMQEWEENRRIAYASDELYPVSPVRLTGTGSLRKYFYARVAFFPFTYRAQSGRLIHHASARIRVNYLLPEHGSAEAQLTERLLGDTAADDKASALFLNYQDMEAQYRFSGIPPGEPRVTYDYVIITTSDRVNIITNSGFMDWKESLGFSVNLVTTTDPEIAGQPGVDLAQKIRNFLREYYGLWGIEYVLLVGDYLSVPMPYCFPDPANHGEDGRIPTDAYYADLSLPDAESWDSDGDGFRGEWDHDNPDFTPEVCIGRIPTYNAFYILHALSKTVLFEQDTGSWKSQALHAGAILFHENQDYGGIPFRDGAVCLDLIETDIMPGWSVSHYSEQAGLEPSLYAWPALTEAAFTSDWRSGQYGVVNWAGHGSPDGAWRLLWTWDDGDGVFETDGSDGYEWQPFVADTSDVEHDYPSIVFAISCLVGRPEPYTKGNLGIDLLTKASDGAAVAIICASRIARVTRDWPITLGGAESYCYEFNRHLIGQGDASERVGDAFYDALAYCFLNFPQESFREYWNQYVYNLYGDPSLERLGIVTSVQSPDDSGPPGSDIRVRIDPNPAPALARITYDLPEESRVGVDIYDVRGRKVVSLSEGVRSAGPQSVSWNGADECGRELSSGIYYCRIKAGDLSSVRSFVLLR